MEAKVLTITEALAEIKTINKKIEKKRIFVGANLVREDFLRDPFEKDGGGEEVLKRELQSISDLEERVVKIRSAINKKNQEQPLKIGNQERSIADWLVWRRDVMPGHRQALTTMQNSITSAKQRVSNQAYRATNVDGAQEQKPVGLKVNVDEMRLAQEIEEMENVLGNLDGQLSLLNALTKVEVYE
jgi:hypothetical protein